MPNERLWWHPQQYSSSVQAAREQTQLLGKPSRWHLKEEHWETKLNVCLQSNGTHLCGEGKSAWPRSLDVAGEARVLLSTSQVRSSHFGNNSSQFLYFWAVLQLWSQTRGGEAWR